MFLFYFTFSLYFQEQYLFVYDVLLEALICGDTTVPVDKYLDTLSDLLQYDEAISKTKMDEQFEVFIMNKKRMVRIEIFYCFLQNFKN